MTMDSSFMGGVSMAPTKAFDSFMDSLRAQITAEVKSDITSEIIDRVIRVVGTAIQNPQMHVTVNPIVESIKLTQPAPIVEIELDDIVAELKASRECMERCLMKLSSPIHRTVNRGPDNLIISITDRPM